MAEDTPPPNAAQIELWNGRGGAIWTRLQTRLDQLFEPLTAALLAAAAIKERESITEIGCGCGDVTLLASRACGPDGRVLAVDISAPMLQRAQTREAECRTQGQELAPIQWLETDAMLQAFAPRADLVISRFGVMFFEDPIAAFINIRKALKPDGRLVMICWAPLDQNPWFEVPWQAVRFLAESKPAWPPGAPGPFAFADPSHVLDILSKAGFTNITTRSVDEELTLGRAPPDATDALQSAVEDALIITLETGLVAALLREADDATHVKVRDAIAAVLRPYFDLERRDIALKARCWIYQASNS